MLTLKELLSTVGVYQLLIQQRKPTIHDGLVHEDPERHISRRNEPAQIQSHTEQRMLEPHH